MRMVAQEKIHSGQIGTLEEDSANPAIPEAATVFFDELDELGPGSRESLVSLSKPTTVYLDGRVTLKGSLEQPSRDLIREVWQMYNAMASFDQNQLADFDCSEFPWLSPMIPQQMQGPTQPQRNNSPKPSPASPLKRKASFSLTVAEPP
jgi:hypothetical protein